MKIDPVEELIQSVPLRSPSPECDQKVIGEINARQTQRATADYSGSKFNLIQFGVSIAVSLLIGFFVGMAAREWNQSNSTTANTDSKSEYESSINSFELADHIRVLDGQSETTIVGESIQWQNNVPVRKVETVTRKKVLVRDQADNSEKEVEIPIRKTFFTLAETI